MAKCYDRNGNEDDAYYPCSQDGNPAQCCGDGERCASNGLCIRTEDSGRSTYWQNTCSVDDWYEGGVETCPTQCMNINFAGNGVTACGDGTYCCTGYGGCDCNNSTQTFSLGAVRIVGTATSLLPTSTSTSTTSTSTTTSTNTNTSTPTPTPSTPSDDSDSSDSNLSVGLGVGLGVGIPLVVGAIVGFWFLRRRRARAAANTGGVPPVVTVPNVGPGGGAPPVAQYSTPQYPEGQYPAAQYPGQGPEAFAPTIHDKKNQQFVPVHPQELPAEGPRLQELS
ncbi:hypothetical protein BJY04DRAFT_193319 [Aspergillus karnatakaensis]|uniref:uncharacterized protein n=1 Tax=Aspergillus karnatakaensis TaxID=1810916 RepID=UPI003CCE138F